MYFRIDRLTGPRTTTSGVREGALCHLGNHKTMDQTYNAVGFGFDMNKHMAIKIFKSCIEHVPDGSWVEGRDSPTREADPDSDKVARYIDRKYRFKQ